ncbi:hypothetical protein D8Y22_08375 [Salinadaptatus halalkaliphilus]|uniref:DUF5305 domain-containing protein n=1 Tax=Salinadaptatus halalkaliphilus TaxID=2419781 RepID=A0A4S3TM04_9EURY|nr:DUF5305 domain-containing protein [Salinadaptatus halalkaliphilus]THE65219.1 hypothetical protein D8Y22_08375 [Salinadaptatus halalkaliphilus]
MLDNPRLDLVLATHGRRVVIVLLVLGVLAIGATGWAVANPETETSPQFAEHSVTTDVHTSASVVDGGSLWEEGDQLSNSPVYVLGASPELEVQPVTQLTNETERTPIEDGTVTHELTVRLEATRDGEAFWNESNQELESTGPVEDGVSASSTTIDIESLVERQRQLEEEIGTIGDVAIHLDLAVTYETETHEGAQTATTTIDVDDNAYWLAEPLSVSDTNAHRTGTERTTQSRHPLVIGGLSLVGTLSLAGAVVTKRRLPVDEDEARQRVHEQRYAEWISLGSIPMWIGDHHLSLNTLEDVVDVAIDTNERVVYDAQRGLFAVVNGNIVYYYSERGTWEQTTWPEMGFSKNQQVVDTDQPSPADQLSEFQGSDEFAAPDEENAFDDEDVWEQL